MGTKRECRAGFVFPCLLSHSLFSAPTYALAQPPLQPAASKCLCFLSSSWCGEDICLASEKDRTMEEQSCRHSLPKKQVKTHQCHPQLNAPKEKVVCKVSRIIKVDGIGVKADFHLCWEDNSTFSSSHLSCSLEVCLYMCRFAKSFICSRSHRNTQS